MSSDDSLRRQLAENLLTSNAHAAFEQVVKDFPVDRAGIRPEGFAHSAWELLEHMRLAQNDILKFSRSADYQELAWPDEYWPDSPAPEHDRQWAQSVNSFQQDLAAFTHLVLDPTRDLLQPFPWGNGQTLLREALLIIDHNAYHLGQLLQVRRALGAWKD